MWKFQFLFCFLSLCFGFDAFALCEAKNLSELNDCLIRKDFSGYKFNQEVLFVADDLNPRALWVIENAPIGQNGPVDLLIIRVPNEIHQTNSSLEIRDLSLSNTIFNKSLYIGANVSLRDANIDGMIATEGIYGGFYAQMPAKCSQRMLDINTELIPGLKIDDSYWIIQASNQKVQPQFMQSRFDCSL